MAHRLASRSTLVFALSAAAAAACALPSAHADLFSIKASRGVSRTQFVSPGKITEVCIVPKNFPGLKDDPKADAKIADLCTLDFYGHSGPNKDIVTASCPKLVSTNPGVELMEVPDGTSLADYVAKECVKDDDRAGKKIAKFKQSISCSYTPAILAYYQIAQALGGSLEVPETVIRTMDLEEHKKITAMGLAHGKDTIEQTWGGWKTAEASPKAYKHASNVFTDDYEQIYGALSKNPAGELKYSEINAGLNGFLKSTGWANLRNPAPIGKMTSADLAAAGQKIIQMKDISNMLVMDYILSQQDRFGNIHATEYFYSYDGKDVKKAKKKKKDHPTALAGEVPVKEMLLKDNDCGMRPDDNTVKAQKFLQAMRHMAPKNYRKLLAFGQTIKSADVAQYLKSEMLASADDVASIQKNTAEAISILQAACKAGTLQLDLDLESFLRGEDLTKAECDSAG